MNIELSYYYYYYYYYYRYYCYYVSELVTEMPIILSLVLKNKGDGNFRAW
jgi:hypothetical protein